MFDLIPLERGDSSLFNAFDRMMSNDFFHDFNNGMVPCRTDILDKGDKFILKADLPGFRKEEIHLDVDGNRLTLSADHSEEANDKKENYIRKERRCSTLSRSFDMEGIDVEHIGASYQDGVLEVKLPKLQKTERPNSKQIAIQ